MKKIKRKKFDLTDIVKIMCKYGYRFYGWKGAHLRMIRGDKIVHISRNCIEGNEYVKKVLKKAGIPTEELNEI